MIHSGAHQAMETTSKMLPAIVAGRIGSLRTVYKVESTERSVEGVHESPSTLQSRLRCLPSLVVDGWPPLEGFALRMQ